jgi:hypothetical protein
MYQSPQKKSSSWTPASIQKKSKNFSKPGSSAVPAKRDANSAESQDMPSYSTGAADLLTGSIMRSVETQEQSEVETSTVQRQSEPGRAAVAATAPPIVSIPVVQPNSVGIQAKLTVGAIGDVYEQEADRVAAQVMSMPRAAAAPPQVQRFGAEPSPIGMYSSLARSITPVVQKRVDQQVQMYSLVQRAFRGDGNEASGDLESRLNASKGGGNALAPEVRAFMEPRFGADFSSVRVHTGSEAVQMNRELGAQAFAHGSDIYFGAGKSPGNNELTAHELTHVVQQTVKSKQIAQTKTEAIQRFAPALAPSIAFGPVGLTIVGLTIVVLWLNNGGWKEIGRISNAIARGIDGTLEDLENILARSGNAATGRLREIKDYIQEHIFLMGTPRNNQAQNRQFADAVREIERRIGRKLSKDEIRRLHDAISGQDYDYHDIVEEGVGMFGS